MLFNFLNKIRNKVERSFVKEDEDSKIKKNHNSLNEFNFEEIEDSIDSVDFYLGDNDFYDPISSEVKSDNSNSEQSFLVSTKADDKIINKEILDNKFVDIAVNHNIQSDKTSISHTINADFEEEILESIDNNIALNQIASDELFSGKKSIDCDTKISLDLDLPEEIEENKASADFEYYLKNDEADILYNDFEVLTEFSDKNRYSKYQVDTQGIINDDEYLDFFTENFISKYTIDNVYIGVIKSYFSTLGRSKSQEIILDFVTKDYNPEQMLSMLNIREAYKANPFFRAYSSNDKFVASLSWAYVELFQEKLGYGVDFEEADYLLNNLFDWWQAEYYDKYKGEYCYFDSFIKNFIETTSSIDNPYLVFDFSPYDFSDDVFHELLDDNHIEKKFPEGISVVDIGKRVQVDDDYEKSTNFRKINNNNQFVEEICFVEELEF